jgi:hypothetical protein
VTWIGRAGDRRIDREVLNERSVDLELVNGKAAKLAAAIIQVGTPSRSAPIASPAVSSGANVGRIVSMS